MSPIEQQLIQAIGKLENEMEDVCRTLVLVGVAIIGLLCAIVMK